MRKLGRWIAALALLASAAAGTTLVDTLLATYDRLESVICEVQKDTESAGQRVRTLSRVYYQKPDRLHVENVTPVHRRIVADGTNFYSFIEGDRAGFSRRIADLETNMLISLRKVPGTAMDHLLRLRGLSETYLPPTESFPQRRGYVTDKAFVVLSLDTTGRLARIEFFATPTMQQRIGQFDYSSFEEVLPGVWLSRLHKAVLSAGGVESKETSRYLRLVANQPIAPHLFVPSLFFTNVSFVGSFEELYP